MIIGTDLIVEALIWNIIFNKLNRLFLFLVNERALI